MSKELTLHINGKTYEFSIGRKLGQIPESETLLETLRERSRPEPARSFPVAEGACGCLRCADGRQGGRFLRDPDGRNCEGKEITTIEGLSDPVTGELDPHSRGLFWSTVRSNAASALLASSSR